jgi:cell division transport system permease protein
MSAIKSTWHHIRRSPFQSLTALVVMIVCFFSLSFYAIVSNGLSSVLNYFETKPEITIFLKDNADRATIEQELSNYPSIKETKYISKEKALSIYKEQNKNNPMLTEMVTSGILPSSIEVKVSDPKVLEQIYQNYSTRTDIVDEVIYQKDVIESLLDWTNVIRKMGITIAVLIIFISFLTVFTIIGMKITNRKEEIRISRLLGASHFYVKKPFLLEGMFYGIVGSIVGSFISITLSLIYREQINLFFQPIIFINNQITFYLALISLEMIIGIILGLIASFVGAKRYIKF